MKILTYLMDRTRMRFEAVFPDGGEAGKEMLGALCAANNTGDTPLIAAAHKGHGECARLLLDAADNAVKGGGSTEMLNRTTKGGDTAAHVAAGNIEGGDAVLEELLKYADKSSPEGGEKLVDVRNSHGLTPLLIACERNSAPCVRLLLSHGAQPLPDAKGLHPLAVAAFCGCEEAASALLDSTAAAYASLLNTKCGEGEAAPLWWAARTGNAKMCKVLLEAGADIEGTNKDGVTPLGAAEKYKKEKAAEVLRGWKA